MGLVTKESGLWARKFVKAEVSKCGPMVLCMKDTGRTTKQTAKEDLSMQMEMSTMVTGRMTRPMASEYIVISMELVTRATGKKINSMARGSRPGPMERATRETT